VLSFLVIGAVMKIGWNGPRAEDQGDQMRFSKNVAQNVAQSILGENYIIYVTLEKVA
jgi:hypothetical protein